MRKFLLLASVLVLAIGACGTGASPSPSAAAPSVAAPAPASAPARASAPAAGSATVMVADSELGEILVDAEGKTLYAFTDDEGGTPSCYDACAGNWPPLLAEDAPTPGEGVIGELTVIARTDGGEQVKIGDWPLYYYAADAAAGDTTGQGVGGKWFVVGPEGELILP